MEEPGTFWREGSGIGKLERVLEHVEVEEWHLFGKHGSS